MNTNNNNNNNDDTTNNIRDIQNTMNEDQIKTPNPAYEETAPPSTTITLPPLYFQKPTITNSSSSSSNQPLNDLPSELLQHITSFFDWGEYAKFACVQTRWKDIVSDVARYGGCDVMYHLAMSLLDGRNGLDVHSELGVKYLRDLLELVDVKDVIDFQEDDGDDNNTNNNVNSNNKQIEISPYASAMRQLAICHLTSTGVPLNPSLGLKWYQTSYHLTNDVQSSYALASIYENGTYETPIDVIAASRWFYRGAICGHVESMAEYALCLELGCGIERNDEESLDWYRKAAEGGHVGSQFSVGEAFEEARGVPQSDEEACLWYYRAAEHGDEDSKKALVRLLDIARIVVPGVSRMLHV